MAFLLQEQFGKIDIQTWLILVGVALIATAVGVPLYRLYLHPLAKFPGPWEAKISGSWRNKRFWSGAWHDEVLEVHNKYGPVVRIAPNELSVVDEEVTKKLYNHGTKANKTSWYATWDSLDSGPGLFATRDRQQHSYFRKRVSAVYSMSAMLRYEEYIQSCLDLMVDRLKVHAEAGNTVDLASWTDALAFDVVGELAYGEKLGQLETESDHMGIRGLIHQGFYLMSNLGHYPGQSALLKSPIWQKLGLPDVFATFRDWTTKKIVARQVSEGKADREDMLHHFMNMKAEDGGVVGLDAILAEAMNIIGAGADTTSIAMKACIYFLCKNPGDYRKVQQEIDMYYESNKLQRPVTYQQTQEMPYLCAAAREAMRMFPSIPYPLLRYAPPGLEVEGIAIPPGTPVGVSAIAANRNRNVWGNDANTFKPSRWLESEEKTRYLNANDMTFGGNGPRMCIGRNLALVEAHKFLAQFLRNFDVAFVDESKPWRVHTQWFANQHDMHMRIKYRVH